MSRGPAGQPAGPFFWSGFARDSYRRPPDAYRGQARSYISGPTYTGSMSFRIVLSALLVAAPQAASATPTLADTAAFIEQHFAETQPVDRRPTRAETTRAAFEGCTLRLVTRRYSKVASCPSDDVYDDALAFNERFDEEIRHTVELHAIRGAEFQSILKRITLRLADGASVAVQRRARRRPPNTSQMSGQCRVQDLPDGEIVNRDLQIGAMNPDGIAERVALSLIHISEPTRPY